MSLRLPPEEYKAICRVVLDRDGWRCRNCGMRDNLHVHHIIFRSEMGLDVTWNLICLCQLCHDLVHNYQLFIACDHVGEGGGADGEVKFS